MIRNELRPGPLGLSVVVLSARKMKLLPFTVASPRLCACASLTKLLLRHQRRQQPLCKEWAAVTLTRVRGAGRLLKRS